MAQNASIPGGAAASQVDPQELQDSSQLLLKQAAGAGGPTLDTLSVLQQRRAERLDVAARDLQAKYGTKDPDVIAVTAMAQATAEMKTTLSTQAARLKNWPKPRANEWVVFGTVWDKKGLPAPDLTVQVFDKDRKFDDLLGETETDVNGDFSVVYHERDFKETNENLPELYVMVTDVSGKVLYTSRDSVRFQAGRSEYFAIQLGTQPTRKPPKTPPPPKKTDPAAGTTKPAATRGQ